MNKRNNFRFQLKNKVCENYILNHRKRFDEISKNTLHLKVI